MIKIGCRARCKSESLAAVAFLCCLSVLALYCNIKPVLLKERFYALCVIEQ